MRIMKIRHLPALFIVFLTLSGAKIEQAQAFPLTTPKIWSEPTALSFVQQGFNADGIVALSNCSASLVRFKGVSDDAKAIVLTNGHCVGGLYGRMLRPGEVDYQLPRVFQMRLLDRSAKPLASLRAEKIIYATMTDTDLALLELNQTYRQIQAATGVQALLLANHRPAVGTPIEIPSGYWKKTYSCNIDGFAYSLHEGDWTFTDSVRYSAQGCDVIGGTSGSPIFGPLSGEVIAINNTINEDGDRCTLNNPCEVDSAGNVSVLPGRGYAQETYPLYTCLDTKGDFNLSVQGCVLPKGN